MNCVSPSTLYVEALTSNETIFGDKTYEEVVKFEGDHKD